MRSYPRPYRTFLPAAFGLLLLSVASPAAASGGYPGTVQAKVGAAELPLCTICHRDLSGGAGTVIQPFGQAMVSKYGLTGGSATDLLNDALDKAEADALDTDGDGQTDVAELAAGTNPNQAGGGQAVPAKYGCFESGGTIASAPPGSPRFASMAIAGLVAGFLFFRRRR